MTTHSAKDIKVLVVEDEEFLAEAYFTILTKNGYKATVAHDASQAMKLIDSQRFSLILLDIRLPDMSGLELLRAINKSTTQPDNHPRVIVLSNHSVRTEIDSAYNLGAARYMVKSWTSPSELMRVVSETLSS
jgi:DNA-binding response OmpR family regulator